MNSAERRAQVTWKGTLAQGGGTLRLTSGAAPEMPVTWASRTARSEGKTSPEELIAGAHASCYAMAFSGDLGKAGTPPEKLDVTAVVTFEQADAGWHVASSRLEVRGVVPGIDQATFAAAAAAARDGCPVSQALRGNVEISVAATLEPGLPDGQPPRRNRPRRPAAPGSHRRRVDARRQLLVDLVETAGRALHQAQLLHHVVGGGLLLDLLADEPLQLLQGGVVAQLEGEIGKAR